jgi:TolB protein
LSSFRKQRRAADRGSTARRVRQAASSGGGGWTPFGSVAVALVVLLGWVGWFAWGHRPATRDGSPAWSPDGARVAFDVEQDGRRDIYVMDADGTNARPVTSNESVDQSSPAYSRPDGRRIAYDADLGGNREIFVMGADGSGKLRLTSDPAQDQSPAWSPDGRKIVFASDRDSHPSFDLYTMNADGSGVERLTSSGNNGAPQYSPDGAHIAFHSGRDVYVLDLGTRQLHQLTTETQGGDGLCPTWSPGGRQLGFMSARNGRMQIFVMNADGSDQHPVVTVSTGSAIDPQWSPIDNRILYVHVPDAAPRLDQRTSRDRALYIVDIATGKVTRLSR